MLTTTKRTALGGYSESDCLLRSSANESSMTVADDLFTYGWGYPFNANSDAEDAFYNMVNFAVGGTDSFVVKNTTKKVRLYLAGDGKLDSCQTVLEVKPDFCETATCLDISPCCVDCFGICCTDFECSYVRKSACPGEDWRGCAPACVADICSEPTGACCTPDPDCDECYTCEDGVAQSACEDSGGEFQGTDSKCEDSTESCPTDGCGCKEVKCCEYDGSGQPISCSTTTEKECTGFLDKGIVDNCDVCDAYCQNGTELVTCCRQSSGECITACRSCPGGYAQITDCSKCQPDTGDRFECVGVGIQGGAVGCGKNVCRQQPGGVFTSLNQCEQLCDPCSGYGGVCYCDSASQRCVGVPGTGTFEVCCACCDPTKDCTVVTKNPRLADQTITPNEFGLYPAYVTTRYTSLGVLTPIIEGINLTTTQQVSIARSAGFTQVVSSEGDLSDGNTRCNVCDNTDIEEELLECPAGRSPSIIIEYDLSNLCQNDDVKFTISRGPSTITVEVDVKWFGYDAETGIQGYVNEITDTFRMGKNAIHIVDGEEVGGVIPETIELLCNNPCGLTYECYPPVNGSAVFNPDLNEAEGKRSDTRVIADRLSPEYPSRSLTAKILKRNEIIDNVWQQETGLGTIVPLFGPKTLPETTPGFAYRQDLIRQANGIEGAGYENRYENSSMSFYQYHGYGCRCSELDSCVTTLGNNSLLTGLIGVVGSGFADDEDIP
jgi:hypothetical protein